MKFGVFDHLDRNGLPIDSFYEARLQLAQLYDEAGFYACHVAEHHATPLGFAPSPSVYLSALAQRTRRLRFGPLVYCLPLYHPLRLAEEIAMLDQLSGGRLELGVGRGVSPFEAQAYGMDYAQSRERYEEMLDILLAAASSDELDHAGAHWRFDRVPMHLRPQQQPHPPLWFGVLKRDNALHAAQRGGSMITLLDAAETRAMIDVYRQAGGAGMCGQSLFIVVDEDSARARRVAAESYADWRASFHYLYYRHGNSPVFGERASTFEELQAEGKAVAGSPSEVQDWLAADAAAAGIDYLVCQFAFGGMAPERARCSVELFAERVMPALAAAREAV